MEIGWWGGGDGPSADPESKELSGNPVAELKAGKARREPEADSEVELETESVVQAAPLATVSYLPWAAPGVDVAATSEVESTAFRRPFVAPERGFGTELSARPIAEPGDWTAEYSDEDETDEVEFEFDPAELDRALIKKLARRDLSLAEVEQFLEQGGLPAEELDEWTDRVVRLGYVDDARLAENLVSQLRRRKGLGASSIRQELSKRKLPASVISEALGDSDQDDERTRATELAVKRAGQLASYDEATAERRLTGFLMRKGYSSGVVRDAVKLALAARKRPSGGVRFR